MGAKTGIAWTDATWNPVRGCALVSAGCTNCYAMKQAHRFSGAGKPYDGLTKMTSHGPVWTGRAVPVPDMLDVPLRWKTPRRIFVNSMSDLFHEDVPDEFIDRVFAVMALARRHTFQILTKRPHRMQQYVAALTWGRLIECCNKNADGGDHGPGAYNLTSINGLSMKARFVAGEKGAFGALPKPPLPNVHLGVSVEDQDAANERIPLLLMTLAAVRFVSCEPLLGPVDLDRVRHALGGASYEVASVLQGDDGFGLNAQRNRIDWVIVGGESGPKARMFDIAWARSIIAQCRNAEVPCFVKQLGRRPQEVAYPLGVSDTEAKRWQADGWTRIWENERPHWRKYCRLDDRAGADPQEWPQDLRVREFPESRA